MKTTYLYDSTYIKYPEQANSQRQKVGYCCQGLARGTNEE